MGLLAVLIPDFLSYQSFKVPYLCLALIASTQVDGVFQNKQAI
jgi:hypothetical protein